MMERAVRIPMHQASKLVGLTDILDLVDGAAFSWTVLELQAVSRLGSGVDAVLLDKSVLGSPAGVAYGGAELVELAGALEQVLEASMEGRRLSQGRPLDQEPDVIVRAWDSTEWRIETNDSVVVQRIAAASLEHEFVPSVS